MKLINPLMNVWRFPALPAKLLNAVRVGPAGVFLVANKYRSAKTTTHDQ